MKNKIIFPLIAAVPLMIGGCATDTHYVQTGDKEQIISGQINIQDYATAANDAVGDLLASGALDKVSNPPAVLAISRIVNSTGQQVDTDLITKKIRVTLLQNGKAVTTTTVGLGGTAEDPLAKGIQQENEFMNDQKTTRLPDFSLSGKIIQTIDRSGDTRRSTYSFQLTLTDKQGLAVWEGEKEIGKQGTRPAVGF
jgi:uncharacterized protein (TIGR02722 family)